MVRVVSILWIFFVSAACGPDHLVDAKGELQVPHRSIEFPRTWVGHPTTASLVVHNTGKVPLELSLDLGPPFFVSSPRLLIPPGDGHLVPIRFDPEVPGPHDREMIAHLPNDKAVPVTLIASAFPDPQCARGPCVRSEFDPVSERCIETVLEDGTACVSENLCVVDGQCLEGECRGTMKSCGSGDECNRPYCDQATGECKVAATQCPWPANPCMEPVCRPGSGCGERPTADGTPCGSRNCREAHFCRTGSCEAFEAREGDPCDAACGEGACRSKECVRPQGESLDPPIQYEAAEGRTIVFDGVTDDQGMLYWVECEESGCELVSSTDNGFIRWTAPLPFGSVVHGATLVSDRQVVVANSSSRWGVAHRTSDGSRLWEVDLEAELEGMASPGGSEALTSMGNGRILFSGGISREGGASHFLVSLDGETGAPIWTGKGEGRLLGGGPIADREGNVYFALDQGGGLQSIDRAGSLRWRVPTERAVSPVAVHDGRLILSDSTVFSTEDGTALPLGPTAGREQRLPPVLGHTGYFFYAGEDGSLHVQPWEPFSGDTKPAVEALPSQAGGPPPSFTAPLLTQAGGALVAMSQWAGTDWLTELVEFRPDGSGARRCQLPTQQPVDGRASLRRNRWVAPAGERGLHFYLAPRAIGEVSGAGWVGPGGNPQGGRKPR